MGVLDELRRAQQDVAAAATIAGVPVGQLQDGLTRRMQELSTLQAETKALAQKLEGSMADELLAKADGKVLVTMVNGLEGDGLKRVAEDLVRKTYLDVVVLGAVTSAGRPSVVAAVKEGFSISAGNVLDPVSQVIGGGHGKQQTLAVAGGKDASRIEEALVAAKAALDGVLT